MQPCSAAAPRLGVYSAATTTLLAPPVISISNRSAIASAPSLAPDWLRTIASFNPLYHAVLAIRALFNARFGDPDVITGIGMTAFLAVVAIWIASRSFNRATA